MLVYHFVFEQGIRFRVWGFQLSMTVADCVCWEKTSTDSSTWSTSGILLTFRTDDNCVVQEKKKHKTWTKSPQIKDDAKHWVKGWGVIKEQKTQTKTEHLPQKIDPLKMSICTNVPHKPVLYIFPLYSLKTHSLLPKSSQRHLSKCPSLWAPHVSSQKPHQLSHSFSSLATFEAMFLKAMEVPEIRLKRTPLRERRGSLHTSISHWT